MLNTIVPDLELWILYLGLSYFSMFVGALAMTPTAEQEVYVKKLRRPPWAPPAWIFGPIWLSLYTMLGCSVAQLRRQRLFSDLISEMSVYYVLIVLLALWPWIFFRYSYYALGFAWILGTLGVAIATAVLFWQQTLISGVLLLPLNMWLCIAATLNLWALFPLKK